MIKNRRKTKAKLGREMRSRSEAVRKEMAHARRTLSKSQSQGQQGVKTNRNNERQ